MLLTDFVFHTTDGLQNGEAVLLSSNTLFKKNVSWFFCITEKKSQLQTLVSAVPHAWSGVVTQASALGFQMFQSPQTYFCVDNHMNVGKW